jgi:hypothetical protein
MREVIMESVQSISLKAAVTSLKKDAALARTARSQPVVSRTRDIRVLVHRGMAYGIEVAIGLDSLGRLVADTGEETLEVVWSRLTRQPKFVLGNNHEVSLLQLADGEMLQRAHALARKRHGLPEFER